MKKLKLRPRSCDRRESKFFWWEENTLVINILGKPSARTDSIGKPKGHQLKVSVTAAPKLGGATDHMVQFLAGEFGVKPAVVYGRMNVNKQLRIEAPTKLTSVIRQLPLL
jgi:uncharacterized protein YggU (UPF0235/DUF167 family)